MTDNNEHHIELTEEELNNVTGGITTDEVVRKIKQFYSWLPDDILNSIINAINKYGFTAAQHLVEQISKSFPTAKGILDLFPLDK